MDKNIKKLATSGVAAAFVAIATAVLALPIPGGSGYVNLGDSVIIIVAFLFGPLVAFASGATGSALADLLKGYTLYAPFSFFIKGAMGLVVGIFCKRFKKIYTRQIVAWLVGGLVMIVGYFLTDIVLYGTLAFTNLLFNVLQIVVNIGVVSLLYKQLFRIYVLSELTKPEQVEEILNNGNSYAINDNEDESDKTEHIKAKTIKDKDIKDE